MSVSEQERHELYIAVESAIGTEGAARLMEYLPPTGWADVARKSDVEALGSRLSERMDAQDSTWSARMDAQDARWSARVDGLDAKWSARMDGLDAKWSARLDGLDAKWAERMSAFDARIESVEHRLSSKIDIVRAEFYKTQESQTRLIVFGMITMVVVVAALAFGAARLA